MSVTTTGSTTTHFRDLPRAEDMTNEQVRAIGNITLRSIIERIRDVNARDDSCTYARKGGHAKSH